MAYYRANGKAKPERIIFYRDGVSEGQFQEVVHGTAMPAWYMSVMHALQFYLLT